jgi:hypothetical protein
MRNIRRSQMRDLGDGSPEQGGNSSLETCSVTSYSRICTLFTLVLEISTMALSYDALEVA